MDNFYVSFNSVASKFEKMEIVVIVKTFNGHLRGNFKDYENQHRFMALNLGIRKGKVIGFLSSHKHNSEECFFQRIVM